MAKKSNRSLLLILVLAVVAAVIAGYAWMHRHPPTQAPPAAEANPEPATGGPIAASADRVDPANDERLITITGEPKIVAPPRDIQLGIEVNALMLLRYADMLQWKEECSGNKCTYGKVWSPQLINSKSFREPQGHENPKRLPVTTTRYAARDARLGAFKIDPTSFVDPRFGLALPIKPEPFPVKISQLPSNLAISFREVNGTLYAGDPEHPAVGDVRVIYRIVPSKKVAITGTQRGDRIVTQKVIPSS
jgi:hypothetical protein